MVYVKATAHCDTNDCKEKCQIVLSINTTYTTISYNECYPNEMGHIDFDVLEVPDGWIINVAPDRSLDRGCKCPTCADNFTMGKA